jgi:hypothetical protein
VEAASVSRGVPIGDWAGQFFTTSDQPNPPAGHVLDANYVIAGPDYFRTTQIRLLKGRSFNEYDTQSAVAFSGGSCRQRPEPGTRCRVSRRDLYPYQQFPWLLGGPQHLLVRTSDAVNPEYLVRVWCTKFTV